MGKNHLPHYDKPPLTEVVCGVTFANIAGFNAVHFGVFWQFLRNNFPNIQQAAPLSPIIENMIDGTQRHSIEISQTPPLPRVWYVDKLNESLVQLQQDRFLFNWKKTEDNEYSSYDVVIEQFFTFYSKFCTFLKSEGLALPNIRQLELSYINVLQDGKIWKSSSDLLKTLVDHQRINDDRYVNEPEGFNIQSQHILPHKNGRLYVSAQGGNSQPDNVPLMRLDLTARGMPDKNETDQIHTWFDLAHEAIVMGFTDITDKDIQNKVWERKQ